MNQAQKDIEIKKAKGRIVGSKIKVVLLIIMTLAAFAGIFIALPYTRDIRRVQYIVNTCVKQNIQNEYSQLFVKGNVVAADDLNFELKTLQTDYPYLTVYDLEFKQSKENEHEVLYECEVTNPALVALNLTANGVFEGSHEILDTIHVEGRVQLNDDLVLKKAVVDNDNPLFYLLLCFRNMPDDTKTGEFGTQLVNNLLYVADAYTAALGLSSAEELELLESMLEDIDTLSIEIEENESEYIPALSNASDKYVLKNLRVKRTSKDYLLHYILIGVSIVLLIMVYAAWLKIDDRKMELENAKRIETDAERKKREEKEAEVRRQAELAKLEKQKKERQEAERKKMAELKERREERERKIKDRQDNDFEYRIYSGKTKLDAKGKEKRDEIFLAKLQEPSKDETEIVDALIGLVFNPTENEEIISKLKDIVISRSNYQNADEQKSIKDQETVFGWSICALVRCTTLAAGRKLMLKDDLFKEVLERFHELSERMKKLYEEYEVYKSTYRSLLSNIYDSPLYMQSSEEIAKINEINELALEMQGGLIGYCLSENIDFTMELVFMLIASRNGNSFSKFMLQCLVVGLLPYMLENQDDKDIKERLDDLIRMRSTLIDWDKNKSFFEVRIYDTCDSLTFANVLDEILKCANPSLNYGDIQKTVRILENELPGVMYLLREYPLRLIDISEEKTEGFYKMAPYSHVMWTTFNGEKGVGPVTSRYNQVVDQTLPNSVGINLKLFCDSYSTIPVLFHEFCHYLGNANEAAVFLLTHKFSEYFYKKYEEAAETIFNNYTYVYLKKNLKGKTKEEQIKVINELIKQLYGDKMPLQEAKKRAAANINNMNMQLMQMNRIQKWHPEVPYPLFVKSQDYKNAVLIYKSMIRFFIADRTIDNSSYDKCDAEWGLVSEGINDYAIGDADDWNDLDEYLK
ncbi:MAG: cell envelope integrity protein TolA [Clostridia bacterium]|nr:cell envelope integrity protein TolA [Clostridia bacterium]